ncbi:MAG TPA: hypothetical protein VMI52_09680 [Acetobacteraceae bacterium]|nr:hypothetical protein [Acetobacteraceae bacterium]
MSERAGKAAMDCRSMLLGMDYSRWRLEHLFLLVPVQQYARQVPCCVQGIPAAPEGVQLLD